MFFTILHADCVRNTKHVSDGSLQELLKSLSQSGKEIENKYSWLYYVYPIPYWLKV